jgi:ribosomal protein S7
MTFKKTKGFTQLLLPKTTTSLPKKKSVLPGILDPATVDALLAKVANCIIKSGNKTKAHSLVSETLTHIHQLLPVRTVVEETNVPFAANFIAKRNARAAADPSKKIRKLKPIFKKIKTYFDLSPHEVLQRAVINVRPHFILRKERNGAFIPLPLLTSKQESKGIRLIVQSARYKQGKRKGVARNKKEYSFAYFLAKELVEAYQLRGFAYQEKKKMHSLAHENKLLVEKA